jgi:threonine/homoserine/homoserine lactone efflux protein
LVAWVALSALLIVTPGPDTALIIRNALAAGPRASTMARLTGLVLIGLGARLAFERR